MPIANFFAKNLVYLLLDIGSFPAFEKTPSNSVRTPAIFVSFPERKRWAWERTRGAHSRLPIGIGESGLGGRNRTKTTRRASSAVCFCQPPPPPHDFWHIITSQQSRKEDGKEKPFVTDGSNLQKSEIWEIEGEKSIVITQRKIHSNLL